jgi:hypothetical protein
MTRRVVRISGDRYLIFYSFAARQRYGRRQSEREEAEARHV